MFGNFLKKVFFYILIVTIISLLIIDKGYLNLNYKVIIEHLFYLILLLY